MILFLLKPTWGILSTRLDPGDQSKGQLIQRDFHYTQPFPVWGVGPHIWLAEEEDYTDYRGSLIPTEGVGVECSVTSCRLVWSP